MKGRYLVAGGAGGIGSAIVQRLCKDPDVVSVTGTYHTTPYTLTDRKLSWVQVDMTSADAVCSLMEEAGEIDGIINTVGFLHGEALMPEKRVRQLSAESLFKNISLNTLPTMLLAGYGQASLHRAPASVFVSLSARVGSISDNRLGGWYSYRASKAALNMVLKTLAIEWRQALPNCSVAALHPGTVKTGLSDPFSKRVAAEKLFTPDESARCLLEVISQLTPENSGRFWAWDGSEIQW